MKTTTDLSTINGLNLRNVSLTLNHRQPAPKGICQEVGELGGKFYLLDGVTNKVRRITRGAFVHLYKTWKAETAVLSA